MPTLSSTDDGALILDESGVPKQGTMSVGVARQYCGRLGKVNTCQVGVYLGYANAWHTCLVDYPVPLPAGILDTGHTPSHQMWRPQRSGVSDKTMLLKAGGIRLYRKAFPLFLGLILGEFIVGGGWVIARLLWDTEVYSFYR